MSEKDKRNNARRKGKYAFWEGQPLAANPMKAPDSRLAWEEGWRAEQKWSENRSRDLARQVGANPRKG
jgi:hypothetical protein